MNRTEIIIFSLSVGFLIIGIYETILIGISYSYPWLMVSMALLFYFSYKRRQQRDAEQKEDSSRKGR